MGMSQATIKITMPTAGHRLVWVSESTPEGEPPDPLSFSGTEFELKASSTGPETKVWVLDEETNNIATKKLTEIAGTWAVKPAEFARLGRVTVRLEHAGEPVESASINITDGERKIDQVLDSSSKGQFVLYGLKPGVLKLAVTYRSGGKTMDPLKQAFDVAIKRSKAEVTLLVAIADPVATIKAQSEGGAKTADGEKKAGEKKDEKQSLLGNFLIMVLVLGGAAALIFFGLKWMKQNPTLVQSKLDQLGVQTPKGGDPSMDPVAQVQAPTPIAPAPPQKIVLDDSSPNVIGGTAPTGQIQMDAPAMPVAAGAPIFDPRLVGESGQLYTLTDGAISVGREGTHAILLPGESTVSRNHAEIICSGQRVSVKDAGSTNGTFVNGVQVHDEVELKPGDMVQFGSVRFRFEV